MLLGMVVTCDSILLCLPPASTSSASLLPATPPHCLLSVGFCANTSVGPSAPTGACPASAWRKDLSQTTFNHSDMGLLS